MSNCHIFVEYGGDDTNKAADRALTLCLMANKTIASITPVLPAGYTLTRAQRSRVNGRSVDFDVVSREPVDLEAIRRHYEQHPGLNGELRITVGIF